MARIFVGLSGGVDSAVSAAILKESGHDVIGCFIRIWRPEFLECTWREDRLDAIRVAAHLRIPFREVDLSHEYERDVVRPMIDGYARGLTPNPDTACNRHVKFDAFLAWATREGADRIATGHYAHIGHDPLVLRRATDESKDQSYFLAQVPASALEKADFPLGGMLKRDVRAKAAALGLPVATRRDSQGLCFVGDVSIPEFLSRYIRAEDGDILSEDGTIIGRHEGAMLYTRGQRHGLRTASSRPYYVIETDTQANTVTVSHDTHRASTRTLRLTGINRIADLGDAGLSCVVRHHGRPIDCRISDEGDAILVELHEPAIVARGQTCVLYREDRVVASGVVC